MCHYPFRNELGLAADIRVPGEKVETAYEFEMASSVLTISGNHQPLFGRPGIANGRSASLRPQ